MFRNWILVALISILLIAGFQKGEAGQIASHVYTAQEMRASMSPACQALVAANLRAYLAGAQGPDIVGVVQHKLGRLSTMPVNTVGDEAHYTKTGELLLNILYCAKKPEEIAFALGWITHYLNDIYVHPVVNQYGGYYQVDEVHHKVLEQLESKYVYMTKGNIVTEALAMDTPGDLGSDFAYFIVEAYHRTFPANELYDYNAIIGAVEGVYTKTQGEQFCEQFQRAASWCLDASMDFYQAHTSGEGKHNWSQTYGAEFPNMPTVEEYEFLMKPLEWKVTQTHDQLAVEVTVNDNRLHARFTQEWEEAVEKAIAHSKKVMPEVCKYIDLPRTDHDGRKARRKVLAPLFPHVNLDQPDPAFKPGSLNPGNIKVEWLTFEWIPLGTPKAGAQEHPHFTQKFRILDLKDNGYDGGQSGKVSFTYDFKEFATDFRARVMLAEDARYKGYDYLEYLSKYDGKKAGQIGRVCLGEIFDTEFVIPSKYVGKEFTRTYVLLPENTRLDETDTFLVESGMETEKWRMDLAVLGERIVEDKMLVILQVTDVHSLQHTGRGKVAMICSEGGGAEAGLDRLMEEALADLDAAMDTLETLDEGLDLTEEKEAELEAVMMAYEAELQQKGDLTQDEIDELMDAKAMELMAELGGDVDAMMEENEGLAHLEDQLDGPTFSENSIIVQPVRLDVTPLPGWRAATFDASNRTTGSFTKKLEKKNRKGVSYMNADAALYISFTDDQARGEELRKRIEGQEQCEKAFLGDFQGVSYCIKEDRQDYSGPKSTDPSEEDPDLSSERIFESSCSGEGVLKKGELILFLTYDYNITGTQRTDEKGNLLFDGLPDANDAKDKIKGEIDSMLSRIRLVDVNK